MHIIKKKLIILYILFNTIYCLSQAPPPPPKSFEFNIIKILSEINQTGIGDAYPYISPDGLTIYFTSGNAEEFKLYTAKKDSLNGEFKNRKILSSEIKAPVYGCWLTNDQLEIYFSNGSNIYYAKRTNENSEFRTPEPLNLNSAPNGDTYSPSLTPDKQELYVYNKNIIPSILRYKRTGDYSYVFSDTVTKGFEYDSLYNWYHYYPMPGQLSKDGLAYISGFKIYNNNFTVDSIKICIMLRKTIDQDFGYDTFQVLKGKINKFPKNMMPSITADYKQIIISRGGSTEWYDNELYSARDTSKSTVIRETGKEKIEDKIIVYPNPAKESISLQSKESLAGSELTVFSNTGKEIIRLPKTEGNTFKIQTKIFPAGLYYYNLKKKDNSVRRGKFIIH